MKRAYYIFCGISVCANLNGMQPEDTRFSSAPEWKTQQLFSQHEQAGIVRDMLQPIAERYQKLLSDLSNGKEDAHKVPQIFNFVSNDDYAPLVEALLAKKTINTKYLLFDELNRTSSPLLHAVAHNARKNVTLLLNAGANPNVIAMSPKDNPFGIHDTPVTFAIRKQNAPMLTLLLEGGADPNFTHPTIVLPLLILCQNYSVSNKEKCHELARILCNKGALPCRQDPTGIEFLIKSRLIIINSALHFAGRFKIFELERIFNEYRSPYPN